MLTAEKKRLELREVEGVTVVTLTDKKVIYDQKIQDLGAQLLRLVDDGHAKVLINFSEVEFMSSAMFSGLVALHKKVGERHGRLVLCGIIPGIYEVFAITKLNRFFNICDDEAAGLSRF